MPLTKKKFIEFLHQPRKMAEADVNEVELLVRKYPYFQTGRTLLAKAKKIHQPDKSAKYIEVAAVYATDRTHLKKFITSDLFFLNPPYHTEEPIETASATPSPTIPKENKTSQEISNRQASKETNKTTETLPELPLSTTSASDLDHLISEIFRDLEEMKKSKARFLAVEAQIEDEFAQQSASIEKSSAEKLSKQAVDENSFDELNKVKEAKSVAPEIKEVIQKVKQEEEKNQIIEDFIKKEPRISKPKNTKPQDPETKTDLAEKSSRFKVDVTSEYLAEIYIGQGKDHRAIEIYESLSLKFPEKTDYFAALIEKLKKK